MTKNRIGLKKFDSPIFITEFKGDFNETVKLRIRKYVAEHDFSITALANNFDVSYRQMYDILYYKKIIDLPTYFLLCKSFNVPFDYFIGDIEIE